MLYQIFEAQRSLMEPFADFAQAASKLYSNPMSPLGQNNVSQRVSAGYDLLYRLGKDYVKPEFGITSVDVDGVDIAIHERIEVDKAKGALLAYGEDGALAAFYPATIGSEGMPSPTGTPEPSLIAKSQSHGCVRLTNWDAEELSKLVKTGTSVTFLD